VRGRVRPWRSSSPETGASGPCFNPQFSPLPHSRLAAGAGLLEVPASAFTNLNCPGKRAPHGAISSCRDRFPPRSSMPSSTSSPRPSRHSKRYQAVIRPARVLPSNMINSVFQTRSLAAPRSPLVKGPGPMVLCQPFGRKVLVSTTWHRSGLFRRVYFLFFNPRAGSSDGAAKFWDRVPTRTPPPRAPPAEQGRGLNLRAPTVVREPASGGVRPPSFR